MKRWIVCLSLLVILSLVMGTISTSCSSSPSTTSSSPPSSQPTTSTPSNATIIKVAIGIPPMDPNVKNLVVWADNFNAVAGGKFKMEVYPGGVLAGTADTFAATRTRVCEMGHLSLPTLVGYDPIFGVANLPYFLGNYDANTEFTLLTKDHISQVMEKKFNQKLLSSWSMGFSEIYTVKKEVKTMADFKGLVIACDKAIDAKSAELLGGSPVTMDYTEEFQSLQKGVVNSGMATVGFALAMMKYYEVIKYLTVSYKSGGHCGVTINTDVYNSLPADLQKVMIDEGNKYQQAMVIAMRDGYVSSYATCQQNGVTIYNLPEAERAKWQTTCAPISTDYWAQIGPDAAQKMQAWAAQANQKYPYTGQ